MITNTPKAFYITGGVPLIGNISINKAKNATLPLMLAALLTDEPVVIKNTPCLSDVMNLGDMLSGFGAEVVWQGNNLRIQAKEIKSCSAPYHLVSKLRASFVAMGALLSRSGEARIPMPGGCTFGPRPVDRHISAFRELGITINEEGGDFFAKRNAPLKGKVVFAAPTVGGTENVILASVLGDTDVVIENAALEPEIVDLANMLKLMGARIEGVGTRFIEIEGVQRLHGVEYCPIPDRIEAGTLMLAAAATRGHITLHEVNPDHLEVVITKLTESGVKIAVDGETLTLDARNQLRPINVTATEYPGLPTDLQAPFGACLATIEGTSTVTDCVYSNRFTHVNELKKMGAMIDLNEQTFFVRGSKLYGAHMHAADIRAGGALVVAALAARGRSVITGIEYIQRGYENLPERLRQLGANINLGSEPRPELAVDVLGSFIAS